MHLKAFPCALHAPHAKHRYMDAKKQEIRDFVRRCRNFVELGSVCIFARYCIDMGLILPKDIPHVISSVCKKGASLAQSQVLEDCLLKLHACTTILVFLGHAVVHCVHLMMDGSIVHVLKQHAQFFVTPSDELVELLQNRIREIYREHGLPCHNLASIVSLCGILHIVPDAETVECLYASFYENSGHISAEALSDIAWGFATMRFDVPRHIRFLLLDCVSKVAKDLNSFTGPRLVWGIGMITRHPAPPFVMVNLEEFVDRFVREGHDDPQASTNIVWGFARMGYALRKDVLETFSHGMVRNMARYGTR